MKLRFNIEYHTQWGEDIRVLLTKIDRNGNKKDTKECLLDTYDGKTWEGEATTELVLQASEGQVRVAKFAFTNI